MLAAAVSVLAGVLLLVSGFLGLSAEGLGDDAAIGFAGAAVFGLVTLGLWRGTRFVWAVAVVLGAFLVTAGLFSGSTIASLVLLVGTGLALILLLTVPGSARSWFGRRTHSPNHN